jgi:hypothetical protein
VHPAEAEVTANAGLSGSGSYAELDGKVDWLAKVAPFLLHLTYPVAESDRSTAMVGKKGGLARHFEGWEAGLVAVVIALAGVLLAVPLRVEPRDLPVPLVDGKVLSTTRERERALARAVVPALEKEIADPVRGTELYDLRAFGEAFRAYGRAEASDDVYPTVRARQQLLETVSKARALGDDKLLGVRAYQMQLFSSELDRWENVGQPTDELAGLGGRFLEIAARNGWLDRRTVAMDPLLRGIFFKRRWNEVTGLTQPPYALVLDEQRAFYAFLLDHPYVESKGSMNERDACRAADQWRLRKIEELSRIDPSYPYALARGVLFYRLGRYPAAVQALRDYLSEGTDRRQVLRARNYLVAAEARATEEP